MAAGADSIITQTASVGGATDGSHPAGCRPTSPPASAGDGHPLAPIRPARTRHDTAGAFLRSAATASAWLVQASTHNVFRGNGPHPSGLMPRGGYRLGDAAVQSGARPDRGCRDAVVRDAKWTSIGSCPPWPRARAFRSHVSGEKRREAARSAESAASRGTRRKPPRGARRMFVPGRQPVVSRASRTRGTRHRRRRGGRAAGKGPRFLRKRGPVAVSPAVSSLPRRAASEPRRPAESAASARPPSSPSPRP